MNSKFTVFIFLVSSLFLAETYSQPTSASEQTNIDAKAQTGFFVRKNVSVLPLAYSTAASYHNSMLKAAYDIGYGGRFDLNYVPAKILQSGQTIFSSANFNTADAKDQSNIKRLVEIIRSSGVLEEVLKSAGNVDSIMARLDRSKKRVTTDAVGQMKIKAPTFAELKLIMNNTYIGIPVLVSLNSSGESFGYVYWFNLNVDNVQNWDETTFLPNSNEVSINFRQADKSEQSVSQTPSSYEQSLSTAQRGAIKFTHSIVKLAMGMEEFALRGTIQDIVDDIRLDIGKRDGAYIDQGYKIYELTLDANNKISSEYVGFGRIDVVADNTTKIDALSTLYTIIGGFEQGNTAVSYDQGPDLTIKPFFATIDVKKAVANIIPGLRFKDDATQAYGVQFGLDENISRLTGIHQLFFGVKLGAAVMNSGIQFLQGYQGTAGIPIIFDGNLNISKKFYFNRAALVLGAEGGMSTLWFSGTLDSYDFSVSTGYQFSAGGFAGLDFSVTPDLILGVDIGYKYVTAPKTIDYEYAGKKESSSVSDLGKVEKSAYEDMKLGGVRFAFRFSYSLRPLFQF